MTNRVLASVIIDHQGVQFGLTWISFDKLAGYEGPDETEQDQQIRASWYESSVIAKGLNEWRKKAIEQGVPCIDRGWLGGGVASLESRLRAAEEACDVARQILKQHLVMDKNPMGVMDKLNMVLAHVDREKSGGAK